MTTSTMIPVALGTGSAGRAGSRKPARSRVRRLLVAAVAVAAIGAGVYVKAGQSANPSPATEPAAGGRTVTVTSPSATSAEAELILPAQTLPNEQTTLYPRIDGYVAKWHADRGARVTAGQLLAEIDAPELDQQARQAVAALDRGRAAVGQLKAEREQAEAEVEATTAQIRLAEADSALADRELERATSAIRSSVGSRTEYDTALRNRDAAVARVAARRQRRPRRPNWWPVAVPRSPPRRQTYGGWRPTSPG